MLVGRASIVLILSAFGPYFVGGILVGAFIFFIVVLLVVNNEWQTAVLVPQGKEGAILLFTVGDVGAAPQSSACLSFCGEWLVRDVVRVCGGSFVTSCLLQRQEYPT